jgi:hypothetical protein
MTVATTTSKVSYTGDGTNDTFAYTFKIYADADLVVYVGGVLKTLTTHYTVTNAGVASGGNVVFTTGNIPAASEKVVIARSLARTQSNDWNDYDRFPAETLEDSVDRLTFISQEQDEEAARSIKFALTVTDVGNVEVTGTAAERANKVFGFDNAGNLITTVEIGNYEGNWATGRAYVARDIVKDTSNNNIYICITSHTSSGAQPLSTNADSAKWALLVDAASATSDAAAAAASAAAAATSESNAATSETNAGTSATAAAASATAAATSETNAGTSETNAATSATAAASSASAAATSETNAATSASNASTSETNAAASQAAAATSATNAATSETNAGTSATSASTSATNAATSESNASTSATNAASSAAASASSATAAQAAQAAAEAAADNFDDTYLGAKASDPTVDNDGDALTAGDLYFSTTTNRMRVYDGSSWSDVAVDASTIVSKTSTTGSAELPTGTTAQRDGSPSAGYMRFNTTDGSFEGYNGTAWGAIGGGATGGNGEEAFIEHEHTIDEDYTIQTGYNVISAGPLTVTGAITVPSGSTWVIV